MSKERLLLWVGGGGSAIVLLMVVVILARSAGGDRKLTDAEDDETAANFSMQTPSASQAPSSSSSPRSVVMKPGFADWLQDMEAAKRKAAAEKKDLLIAFHGSDWSGQSMTLGVQVFFQPAFREQADRQFVLVLIDFPRTAQGRSKVENAGRNRRVAKRFHITVYPTVLLADADGNPYGVEGYVEGGPPAFLKRVEALRDLRATRDRLFAAAKQSDSAKQLDAIKEALSFLKGNSLLEHYGRLLEQWTAVARANDPKNQKCVQELLFEIRWKLRFEELENDQSALAALPGELDEWKKTCEFRDPDRAATLHLWAALAAALGGDDAEAAKYGAAGAAYRPKDRELVAKLRAAAQGARGSIVGTGFLITSQGHLLTNHHVIEGASDLGVQFTEQKEVLRATVLADDKDADIALLKVSPSGQGVWKPLRLSAAVVSRGAKVGAFGFPLGSMMGSGLKLTTGVVSSTPDESPEHMLLLDCRINPGNSGGPLCDSHGQVVGMITAKSFSTRSVDSYGMALPGETLRDFLAKHLPTLRFASGDQGEPMEWEDVDRRVAPSVVRVIVRSRQSSGIGAVGTEVQDADDADWSAAERQLKSLLKQTPDDVRIMGALAWVLFRQQRREEAEKMLRRAHEADPEVLPPEASLASFCARDGDLSRAVEYSRSAVTATPDDLRTRIVAIQCFMNGGEIVEARTNAKKAVEMDAESADAHLALGNVATFTKDYSTAEQELETALRQSPDLFDASNNLAFVLCEQNDPAKRQRALQYAEANARRYKIKTERHAIEAASTLAWVLYRLGRLDEADAALGPLAKRKGCHFDTLYFAARLASDRGRSDEARTLLETALKGHDLACTRADATALLTKLAPESSLAFHPGDAVRVLSAAAHLRDKGSAETPLACGTRLKVLKVQGESLLVETEDKASRGVVWGRDVLKTP